MSNTERAWVTLARSLQITLQRATIVSDGQILTDADKYRLVDAYLIWGSLTLDIGQISDCSRTCSTANIARWLCRLCLCDVTQVVGVLKDTLGVFRQSLAKSDSSLKRFKKSLKETGIDTRLLGPFIEVIYKCFRGGLTDYELIHHVNTWLQFITRLTFRDLSGLEDRAKEKYLQFEDNLSRMAYSSSWVEKLRYSVNDLFGSWRIDEFRPKFSNGATAEVRRGNGLQKKMKAPLTWGALQLLKQTGCDDLAHFSHGILQRATSKWQPVPKGIDKKRSICMEPSYNQYVQQGVFSSFDAYCVRHPKVRVNLHDQVRNQVLARVGSMNKCYSTIDLSDASDSVTLELVKKVCRDLQPYPYLIRSRTPYIDVDGTTVCARKFSPMGSACCFPIECLVFTSIVHLAQLVTGIYDDYVVYGDDIVVSSDLAPTVIELLGTFGFEVNFDKTFVSSFFTESCGIECFKGFDITPIRLGRRYDAYARSQGPSGSNSSSAYMGCMDLCNQFYGTSYHMTRKYLIKALLKDFPLTFFCWNTEEFGVMSDNPTNGHLVTRSGFSARDTRVDGIRSTAYRYQRIEWYTYVPYSRTEYGTDDLRYAVTLQRLMETDRDVLDEYSLINVRIGRTTTRLRRVWYPGWMTPAQTETVRRIRRTKFRG